MLFGAESLVSLGIHQGVELALVAEFYLDNPVLESILIDEFGLILEGLVDLYNGSADG